MSRSVDRRRSLLAAGITEVSGVFDAGDVVELTDAAGHTVARGVVAFDSVELPVMKGRKTRELAPEHRREVVHADDGIDMCYVADIGRALRCLQTAPALRWPVYNVGSGRVTTNAEVEAAIAAVVPDAPAVLPPGHNPDSEGGCAMEKSKPTTPGSI